MEEGGEGKCVKNISPERWRRLSHKERRTYVNKQRRRYRRRCLARKRETARTVLESQPEYMEGVCEEEKRLAEELRRDEARSMLENAAWMQRERVAQEEFSKKRELEERRRSEREERERLIHEEWEALKKKEKEETEAKEKEKMEKEERLKEALSVGDKPPVTGKESWHNPIAPEGYETSHTPHRDMEVEQNHCSFFLKTGACRFGDRCSRQHPRPTSSCTLLIPAMYSCLGLQEQMLNEKNQDAALEHDEEETYEDFRKFYDDVLPEFLKAGKVVQFKVSCNHEAHLRGNVYVQYTREEECAGAFQMFNGRWYAQKQLSCTFCPVTKWKSAICGLFNQKRCPKGKHCNFLHVFRNPTGAFSRADRDLPPLSRSPHLPHHSSQHHSSPLFHRRQHQWDRNRSFSYSSRQRSRSRSRSESRERSRRRHQRPRSRSRERYHRSHWRSESSERSKYNKRSPQKSESRERRSRSRSESRDRNYRRSHSRSESRERSRRNHHRSRSRSKSRERCPRLRSESKSPDGRSSLSKSPSSCNGRNHQRSHRKKRRKGKKHSSLTSKHIKHRHKSKKKHSCHHHHTLEAGPPQDECRPSEVQDKPTKVQDNLTELQDDPTELQDDPTELQDDPTELQDDPTELQDDPTELQDKDRV